MFGSKIRSWMENHIVRPRKKGNKNKNGSSNFPVPISTQNGQKGTGYTIYHDSTTNTITESTGTSGATNTISSPARRREISPIQSHTTSRFGWQSPQHDNIMSPKSDHFLHIPNNCVKSQTIHLESLSASAPKYSPQSTKKINEHILKNKIVFSNQTTSSKDKKHKSLPPTKMFHKRCSSPKRTNTNDNKPQINCQRPIKSNSVFSINKNIEHETPPSKSSHSSPSRKQNHQINSNDSSSYHHHQQQEFQSNIMNTSNQQNDINVKNNNDFEKHNPDRGYTALQQNNDNIVRYGKILTSKRSNNDQIIGNTSTCYNLTNSMLLNYNNNDNINANIPAQYHNNNNSADQSNYNNNGNHIYPATRSGNQQQQTTTFYHHPNLGNHQHSQLQNNNINSSQFHSGYDNQQQQQQRFNGNGGNTTGVSGNMIRGGARYNGNTLFASGSNCHPLAHVINSLSSPESAYSTGYSTDGTSPGTTYTPPEYYINIRTGTHYFPKSVNTLTIEATRQKFGLNKIEEMSPQDPLPNNHRRTESLDCNSQNKIAGFGIPDLNFYQNKEHQQEQIQYYKNNNNQQNNNPNPIIHQINNNNNNVLNTNFKGFESPSPRQRCRIRTNPWYSTTETSSSGNTSFLAKKIEFDGSSSSSGIKSSSEAGASDKNDKNEKTTSESETESSSTEIEAIAKTCSPGTIRRRIRHNSNEGTTVQTAVKSIEISYKSEINISHSLHPESDEDATLNEMMGKFDESYVYEKETDILSSDSDPTDCPSDLDTGQDAGDEYDTDDLLKIDFIDTGSIQEIVDKSDGYKNTGSCSYYNYQLDRNKITKNRRSRRHTTSEDVGFVVGGENIGNNNNNCNKNRKKRLLKTRKKSCESKYQNSSSSPIKNSRESRSLGGTPVSLRRCNKSANNPKTLNNSPLANRSNSMTFTEVHAIRGSFMAIAESEKAILKADLEADVKYKQLIHEAETILVSMKGCTLRDTPIASPRRICNPPANKRVEILRNCEADIKRELIKHQQQKLLDSVNDNTTTCNNVEGFLVNKHLEKIRYDKNSNSAPNSPKCGRMSPRKTHITNFINQIAPPEIQRRSTGTVTTTTTTINYQDNSSSKSPQQRQLKDRLKVGNKNQSPSNSKRRFRSQSPRVPIYSDSDSDKADNSNNNNKPQKLKYCKSETETYSSNNNCRRNQINNNRKTASTNLQHSKYMINKNDINYEYENQQESEKKIPFYDESDYDNKNVIDDGGGKPQSILSFRSIDMGNRTSHINNYCPQSEPLKRKIYRGSSSFERLKKSLDLESEIPKQVIIEKMKREQNTNKSSNTDLNVIMVNNQRLEPQLSNDEDSVASNLSTKQQMILNTIEDLKKSLEDQSIELNGLHIKSNKI